LLARQRSKGLPVLGEHYPAAADLSAGARMGVQRGSYLRLISIAGER
jgi:hypothetical protein